MSIEPPGRGGGEVGDKNANIMDWKQNWFSMGYNIFFKKNKKWWTKFFYLTKGKRWDVQLGRFGLAFQKRKAWITDIISLLVANAGHCFVDTGHACKMRIRLISFGYFLGHSFQWCWIWNLKHGMSWFLCGVVLEWWCIEISRPVSPNS